MYWTDEKNPKKFEDMVYEIRIKAEEKQKNSVEPKKSQRVLLKREAKRMFIDDDEISCDTPVKSPKTSEDSINSNNENSME